LTRAHQIDSNASIQIKTQKPFEMNDEICFLFLDTFCRYDGYKLCEQQAMSLAPKSTGTRQPRENVASAIFRSLKPVSRANSVVAELDVDCSRLLGRILESARHHEVNHVIAHKNYRIPIIRILWRLSIGIHLFGFFLIMALSAGCTTAQCALCESEGPQEFANILPFFQSALGAYTNAYTVVTN
jgi:hypothetical protein